MSRLPPRGTVRWAPTGGSRHAATRRVSRRRLMRLALMGAAGLVVSARALPAGGAPASGAARRDPDAILRDLLDGNRRFAGGQAAGPRRKPEDFATLAAGQTPDAVIVGCADSRVAPEILFDQGVGDLFVVRVAGNVVSNAGVDRQGQHRVRRRRARRAAHPGARPHPVRRREGGAPAPRCQGRAARRHRGAGRRDQARGGRVARASRATRSTMRSAPTSWPASRGSRSLPPIVAPAVKRGKVNVVGGVYDLKSGAVTMIG